MRGWLIGVTVVSAAVVALAVVPPPSRAQRPPASSALPEGYVGAEACKACHEPAFNRFATTRMGRLFLKHPRNTTERLGCENCHGPGKAHVDAGGGRGTGMIAFAKNDPTPVERRNQACIQCHAAGQHLFWKGSAHEARDIACTNCHTVMHDVSPRNQLARPTEIETCGRCHVQQRAKQLRNTHMPLREGKMSCSSCHNPHGAIAPALLRETTQNTVCLNCHADKRGPFLWPHAPVVESCQNCHDPHGSNHETMLKVAKPRLCQQCHIESRHPTNPYGREIGSMRFVMGKACSSCHVNIHGSNHPSGFAFTR